MYKKPKCVGFFIPTPMYNTSVDFYKSGFIVNVISPPYIIVTTFVL